jgi:hypothetical protein
MYVTFPALNDNMTSKHEKAKWKTIDSFFTKPVSTETKDSSDKIALKCRNFYDIEFSQKATTRLCFPLFLKFLLQCIPYLFYFFCSLFFFQHADVHATACWRIGSYAPDIIGEGSTAQNAQSCLANSRGVDRQIPLHGGVSGYNEEILTMDHSG